jgi:hypothetical protein
VIIVFKRRTLFILGAGASEEVGLPLGTLLARQITNKMDIRFQHGHEFVGAGDLQLYTELTNARREDSDQWFSAATRIREGLPFARSIDDFLDQRRTDKWINTYGKAAICKRILEAERDSSLFFDPFLGQNPFEAEALLNTWFVKFMYMLCRGIPRERVAHIFENVDFISFNYDRCIEHFLISALQRAYSIKQEDAVAIIEGLDVLHPYGSVGLLRDVKFGAEDLNCVALSERIKTYTEQADEKTVLQQIQARLRMADQIVFLGFAFHSQNMEMLKIPDRPANKIVYGTAFGMSGPDMNEGQRLIARVIAPQQVYMNNNIKCAALLDEYSMSLTGGD